MAAANRDRLEQVLGPGWRLVGVGELCRRERQLEAAAGFARTLVRYMYELHLYTAGDALAVLAERQRTGTVLWLNRPGGKRSWSRPVARCRDASARR